MFQRTFGNSNSELSNRCFNVNRHVFVKRRACEWFAVRTRRQTIDWGADWRTIAETLPVSVWQCRCSAPDVVVDFNGDVKLPSG